jgi:WD40 repeat protein
MRQEGAPPWAEWAAAHARWPKLERVRLDMGNFSLEMIERRLVVRTELGGPRSAYYVEDTQQHLAQLRGHFDELELVSCGVQPLPEEQAEQWAKAIGSRQFTHIHQRSNEPVTGSEADRALTRSQTRRRKAKSRIARAAKQTRAEPPRPRRYGPGHVGAWLVCDGPERRLNIHWGTALAFTPDGRELLVVGSQMRGLSPPELQLAWALRDGHRAPPCSFAVEPSSQRAWIGALNGATILWDLQGKRELAHSRFHRARVNGVAIDGERMFSADIDRTLHVWRYPPTKHDDEPITLVPEQSLSIDIAVLDMAFDPAATTLALLGRDQVQWRDPEEPLRRLLTATVARATCHGWSPRGDHFVVGSEDGTISVWDLDGTQLTKLRVHQRRLGALTWTPDGTRLITAGEDETGPTLAVIDCETGERLLTIRSSLAGYLGAVACSPDGSLLAASAYGVACWTLPDGAPVGLWRTT